MTTTKKTFLSYINRQTFAVFFPVAHFTLNKIKTLKRLLSSMAAHAIDQLTTAIWKFAVNFFGNLLTHLSVFYFDLDPIKDLGTGNSVADIEKLYSTNPQSQLKDYGLFPTPFNLYYLIPLLCALAIDFDSLFLVVVQYGGRYNASGMPELFTHRIAPQAYWDLSDVIYNTGIAIQMVTFTTLTFHPQVPSGRLMWAVRCRKAEQTRIFCGRKCKVLI